MLCLVDEPALNGQELASEAQGHGIRGVVAVACEHELEDCLVGWRELLDQVRQQLLSPCLGGFCLGGSLSVHKDVARGRASRRYRCCGGGGSERIVAQQHKPVVVPPLPALQGVEVPEGARGQEMRQLSPASWVEAARVGKEFQRGGFNRFEDKMFVRRRPLRLETGAEPVIFQGLGGDGVLCALDAGAESGIEAFGGEWTALGFAAIHVTGPIAAA